MSALRQIRAALAAQGSIRFEERDDGGSLDTCRTAHQVVTFRIAPTEPIYSVSRLNALLAELLQGVEGVKIAPLREQDGCIWFGGATLYEPVGTLVAAITDEDMKSSLLQRRGATSWSGFFKADGAGQPYQLQRFIRLLLYHEWEFAIEKDQQGRYRDRSHIPTAQLLEKAFV